MIQVRHVPESVHRTLKARAALAGMSLSDYLLAALRQIAERPTLDEIRGRVRSRARVTDRQSTAEDVRAEREAR
jgi:hypothetical protein